MDNSTEFAGSFGWLCKELGMVDHHITIGNSKTNRQVERTIQMPKDCIQRGLTKEPAPFWMNHLALAQLLLCIRANWMIDIMLFPLATGC